MTRHNRSLNPSFHLLAILCAVSWMACAPGSDAAGPGVELLAAEVLATVNGAPITREDVDFWVAKNTAGRQTTVPDEHLENVLEPLIRLELLAQRATAVGLDRDPDYLRRVRLKQAEMSDLRRQTLSKMFLAREITNKVEITDAEIEAYYAEHAAQIRNEYHVRHIMKRDRSDLAAIAGRIAAGAVFEEAAAAEFPKLPEGAPRPWDLGYVHWEQLPEPWRPVIETLEPGGISEIIQGSKKRFWIIKLVAQREDPTHTVARAKTTLVNTLTRERLAERRASADEELRANARIVYAEDLGPAP